MYYNSVLLIDEDIDDRDLFCVTIKEISSEIDCVQFSKGFDALDHLANTQYLPEIIFVDIDMRLIDDKEFLIEMKNNERIKDIPIYIYSTPFMIGRMEDSVKKHVSGYLFKTTNFNDFERNLYEALKRPSIDG